MRKPALLLPCLLGACFCAQPQTLHQCSGQGGTTAYRSGACLPGEALVAVREMEADVAPAGARDGRPVASTGRSSPARAAKPRSARAAHAGRKSTHARSKRRKSTVDPCTREKRARDDFRRRRGIKVTMAELSRWNHRVYDACK